MQLTSEATRTTQTPLGRHHLLLHYVGSAQSTLQSIDQLGNFLMGFGVLALGYLLQSDLSPATDALGVGAAGQQLSALMTLGAWGTAVGLLVIFVQTYVFRVIAGRSVHATNGKSDGIGKVMAPASGDLSWNEFSESQRTFDDFLRCNYLRDDRRTPESLLYARWSYMRYMVLKKLAAMERMRGLLGLALLFGVGFKVLLVYQTALATS